MSEFDEKFNELTKTEDTTAEFDRQDIQNNKAMGILAYLGILVLIPIFAAKDSKFARFHANQGLLLAIAEVGSSFICGILSRIPWIGWTFNGLQWAVYIACTVFTILGIINAAKGQAKELPLIGKIKILK